MEEYIGIIKIFGGTFEPRGWAFCNGQLLSISQNTALFSILGTTYGGDGHTTFALPDLRGRVPVGAGQGNGTSHYQPGQQGGKESTPLTVNQMPPHTHTATVSDLSATIKASDQPGTEQVPGTNGATTIAAGASGGRASTNFNNQTPNVALNTATEGSASVEIGVSGGGQPVEIVQPYLGVNYIICLQGLFPPRN